ncbi:DeoR/GlpR family DNA-binding transcription regulator [Microbacterium amylolyticum]|uniref:Lactose phosphotransferase system repressor n=1 Tax=Microbacterium amylolyticum TaxID=936337 RepID=A0ABS4ZJ63_9MICO|nr:DeoR/GlpR family DNA-binding transcription regulator [Microbacterium amylolyticum]MBP2437339.1 DeoR family fructose operon transcriptional repressor [Microbacterium amylolyticum]
MYATERQENIAREVRQNGNISVRDIAERFDVTTETARRDLAALEKHGLLRRVHGGAVSAERASITETGVAERQHSHEAEKTRIATLALSAVPAGFRGSVLVDAGTTTGALLEPLAARLTGGRAEIVTNAVAHAAALAGRDGLDLTVLGGRVRSVTGAAVGATTVAALEAIRPDIAFVGANGLSAAFGLSTPDPDEAAVKRAMVTAARRTIALVDSSKFDVESLHRFAELSEIDVLVTNEQPSADLATVLAAHDVEVWDGTP